MQIVIDSASFWDAPGTRPHSGWGALVLWPSGDWWVLGGEQVCEGEAQARAQVERSLAPLAQLLSGAQWYSDDLNLVLASPGAGVRWLPREAPAAQLADAAARLAALRIQIERGSPLPGSFPAHQAQQAAEVRAASQGNRAERRAQLRRQWDERQNAGRQKKD